MNERIQKLSNIWANRRELDEQLGITYTFNEAALEKFTELIVKECLTVVNNTPVGYKDYRSQIEASMRDACCDELQKHFGIVL